MRPAFDRGRVRALLFDLDGTLADTDDFFLQHLARLLGPLLPPQRAALFARKAIMASETWANRVFAAADLLGLDNMLAPVLSVLHGLRGESRPPLLEPVSGAPEALRRLHQQYPMAIVTAREAHSTHAFLEAWSLSSYFQCIATGRTCWRTKPHPAPLLWAAHRLGVPPSACLMVGDTPVDIRAGRAAAMQTVGVLCGFGERPELERAGAKVILESTADLPALLLDAPSQGEDARLSPGPSAARSPAPRSARTP